MGSFPLDLSAFDTNDCHGNWVRFALSFAHLHHTLQLDRAMFRGVKVVQMGSFCRFRASGRKGLRPRRWSGPIDPAEGVAREMGSFCELNDNGL
jgi:hypothetical protein